jgi:hypothetical protein
MSKTLKKYLIIITVALVSTIAILFLIRNSILQSQIKKIEEKFLTQYNAQLHINEAGFSGLTTVQIHGISLIPADGDTLLKVDSLEVRIKLLPLIIGHIRFKELIVSKFLVTAIKKDSVDNFSFLLQTKKNNADSITKEKNYAELAWKLVKNTFDKIPSDLNLSSSKIGFKSDSIDIKVDIPALTVYKKELQGRFIVNENNRKTKSVNIKGNLNSSARTVHFSLFGDSLQTVNIPYITNKWNAKIDFDTLNFGLDDVSMSAGVLTLTGLSEIRNLVLNHPKLSATDVKIATADIVYKLNIGEDYIAIDSASILKINKAELNPFIKYKHLPAKEIAVKLNMKSLPAQNFFESLPEGMFTSFNGIQTKGNLSYKLDFYVNMNNIDSLKFNSDMDKQSFKITKFGEEFIPKINGSFSYTAYEKGVPMKTFIVGPENPNFTPYDQISDFLKNAVLTSEDGSFFGHRGFNEDAFRKSIIENIKKGRFARGGSTISMQLVKNVYLSRNKTIARKAEEALIVWMIENNGLSSKQRMFEVYLNIIEWGPRIYGVKEASEFYFKKRPAELSLAECIYLASIIPRPKAFMYSFDADGNLRPDLAGFYRIISGILLKKGVINQNDYDELKPEIKLKGNAKFLLRNANPADTLNTGLWQSFKNLFR